MCKVISLTVLLVSLIMMSFLIYRSVRNKKLTDKKQIRVLLQLVANSFLAFTWLLATDPLGFSIAAELWLAPFALVVLLSPRISSTMAIILSNALIGLQTALIVLNLIDISDEITQYFPEYYIVFHLVEGMSCLLVFTMAQWFHMKDIKSLLTSGSVWNNLEDAVDSVYVVFLISYPLLLIALHVLFPKTGLMCLLLVLLELGMMVALCHRISYETHFVLMQKHETLILESLKVSQLEMSVSGQNDMYKELYERVVAYFEAERPYLNSRLTINDVAKVVYSNRLYMSRAISQSTGRNFCQFVNYYRIAFAIESFRSNPELKVGELSEMSGFNSPVTFNVAFHLFMNDNPSEWFRKERVKILNKKK